MKKMLILGRFVKEYEPVRLKEEGQKAGLKTDIVKYGQITFGVNRGKAEVQLPKGKRLGDYDLVVLRAASKKGSSMVGIKEVVTRELLSLPEVRCLNLKSFSSYPLLGKMEQGMMLAKAELPTVDFVSFGNKKGWEEFRLRPTLAFPMVIKGRFGSHGRTVRLVSDWGEFKEAFSEYKEGSVLVQPKLRVKQWYRCIVVGGKYLGEMRHRQKEKYGGEEGKLIAFGEVKMERLKKICLSAAALFECDYAGLDVVWDEDRQNWVILEVNRTAQFKYFERRVRVNVAEKIVEFLER